MPVPAEDGPVPTRRSRRALWLLLVPVLLLAVFLASLARPVELQFGDRVLYFGRDGPHPLYPSSGLYSLSGYGDPDLPFVAGNGVYIARGPWRIVRITLGPWNYAFGWFRGRWVQPLPE